MTTEQTTTETEIDIIEIDGVDGVVIDVIEVEDADGDEYECKRGESDGRAEDAGEGVSDQETGMGEGELGGEHCRPVLLRAVAA